MRRAYVFLLSVFLVLVSAVATTADEPRRCLDRPLNEVQIIGSHNSYRVLPPPSVLAALEDLRPGLREKIEYEHPPLETQLDLGLRLLELDFYNDPEGGRFAEAPNLRFLGPEDPKPFAPDEIAKPGFKVMHIQGYDNYSHCIALRDCLLRLRAWSDAHPAHTLITVTMNVKEDRVFEDAAEPVPFDRTALDELDALLIEAFGRDRLLTPDDVRGDRATLRDAIVQAGWPDVAATRGKFMFVLDEGAPRASLIYRDGHPSLRDRMMFAGFSEEDDEAAVMVVWDMKGREDHVARLVEKGFIVRVSADIGTREARTNDGSRFAAAVASGAQLIATDYYPGHASPFATAYLAAFEGGRVMRCE